MSRRTKRILGITLVVVVVACVTVGAGIFYLSASYERAVSIAFEDMLFKLESGSLKTGDANTEVVGWPLPTTGLLRTDHLGDQFGFLGYASRNRSLHFYAVNGSLFAAQYVEGIRSSTEKWYFCDIDLLERYIELSRKGVEP